MPSRRKKPPTGRQQRRVGKTRKKLLQAARSVFAVKGLDSATIADITEAADVGKGTFYYHFRDKNGVISALIREVLGGLNEAIESRCEGIAGLPELLDTIIRVHIEFFSARWEDFVLYFNGRGDLFLEEGYEGIETPFIGYLETMERMIDRVVGHRLPKPVLRRIGCATAGFVSGYYSFAVIASQDEDLDQTMQSLRGALVAGLVRFITETLPRGAAAAQGS